jgi:hypothetical protein
LNWPAAVPGSPQENSSLPSGEYFVDAGVLVPV